MQPFKSEQKMQDQQWEKWIPGVNPYASSKRIRPTPETPNVRVVIQQSTSQFQPTIQELGQGPRTPLQNIKSQMIEQSTGEIKPECQSVMKLDGGQNVFGPSFQTPARPCAYGNTPKPHIEQSAQVRQVDIALGSKVQSQPMGTPHIPRAHQNPLFGQSQQEMVVNESTKKRVDYGQQSFQDAQIAINPQQMVQSSQRKIQDEQESSRLLVLYQDEAWKRQHSQRSLLPQSQPGKPYVLWQSKPKEASQAQQASQQYQSSQHFMNQQNSQHAIQMPQSSFKSNSKGWQNKENDL